jgi:Cdc6-like AAA superfamily ATPase
MLRPDRPNPDIQDRFERVEFAKNLVPLLFDRMLDGATGFVVGLTGPWGSGKSQVMIYLAQELQKDVDRLSISKILKNSLVLVHFNPWIHSGQQDLLHQFFASVRAAIQAAAKTNSNLAGVVNRVDKLKKLVQRYAGAFKIIPYAGEAVSTAAEKGLENTLEEEKRVFVQSLRAANVSAIVFIDDIDRLSDEEVRSIAQLVKSVADFPMFSYLLAYDPDRVAKALGHDDVKLGYQYLEKIVQVQARLPRVTPARLAEEIRDQIFDGLGKAISDRPATRQDWADVIRYLVPDIISTPRDARRLAASMTLRWANVVDAVHSFDLLRYCALEARVPVLSERLQNLTSRITVDGSRELRRRRQPVLPAAHCIQEILGEYSREPALKDVLLYLFPALREDGTEEIARDDDRLCYETPLLSLLNYGPLPGMITRDQAAAALLGKSNELADLLTQAADGGRLRHAVLRMRRVYRDLESEHKIDAQRAAEIWTRLGAFFDRPIATSDLVKWDSWLDLTHVFVRGALRHYLDDSPISTDFVGKLIKDGQMHLPARILMFHLHAHSMCRVKQDLLLTPKLSRNDTQLLVELASKQFAQRIIDATQWPLRSVTPLWIIRAADQGMFSRWQHVKEALNNLQRKDLLDGVLILAMRHRDDLFQGTSLAQELDLAGIAQRGHALQKIEPELRTPTEEAYLFLRSQLRD